MVVRISLLAFSMWMAPFGLASVAMAQGEIVASVAGSVTLTAADGATFPAAGVRLILNCESQALTQVETSDERGAFRFESVRAEGCTIVTDLQGFKAVKATIKGGDVAGLQFHLQVEPLLVGVTVTGGNLKERKVKGRGHKRVK